MDGTEEAEQVKQFLEKESALFQKADDADDAGGTTEQEEEEEKPPIVDVSI